MKNPCYFMLKAPFVKIFKFLSWFIGHVEIWPGKKAKVNFKIYDVTDWETNRYYTLNAQYIKK